MHFFQIKHLVNYCGYIFLKLWFKVSMYWKNIFTIWFTDENSRPLEIRDNINLTLFINWCVIYKIRYSTEPSDWIFVKGYRFLSSSKNTGKNTINNVSKNLSSKCNQKLLDHAKQSATDALKTASKNQFKK